MAHVREHDEHLLAMFEPVFSSKIIRHGVALADWGR